MYYIIGQIMTRGFLPLMCLECGLMTIFHVFAHTFTFIWLKTLPFNDTHLSIDMFLGANSSSFSTTMFEFLHWRFGVLFATFHIYVF